MFFFYFEAWLTGWHAFLLEFRWLSSWTLNSEDRPKTLLYKPESLLFLKGLSGHLVSKWQGLLIYTTVKKSKVWSCGITHLFFIPYYHTLLPFQTFWRYYFFFLKTPLIWDLLSNDENRWNTLNCISQRWKNIGLVSFLKNHRLY